ncbi:unnamed protein product [Oikopleura dioica]|uniref:BTB domain-containing protein n=2 Tax=Oikopleura dioica TaxID=34765 RepID=E4Z672_OIKDI|nr:unnamed protein product [Oikopleura dioica]
MNKSERICAGGLGVEDGSSAKQNSTSSLLEILKDNVKTLTINCDDVLLPQVITLGEKIVVFGGRKNPKNPNRNLKIFRARDCETIYTDDSEVFGVYRSAICKVSESSFLCFGGRRSNGNFSNEMYEINVTEADSLSVSSNIIKFEDELPRLASATCVSINDSEYEIMGGIKPDGFISQEIFRFKVDGTKGLITWRRSMEFGIYGHSVYINGNKMLVIGGISTLHEINDSVIEIDRESWKVRSVKETSSTELLLVGNGARVTKDTGSETEIEIIGGGAHCFAFGNHLNPLISTISF